ncbi:hypothetical protein AB836_00820 [Rickettsiales bacterium (ex Bugula neritina AB1)]|nr:hypothetical protein AB836_00820 [Rickettsiales bacterium (ex Bugula neritina AB1)]
MFLLMIIEDLPIRETKQAISYFKDFKTYFWKDGFYVYKEKNQKTIKGPKIEKIKECELFKEKIKRQYKDNYSFYNDKRYIYGDILETEIDFLKIIQSIKWINPIKIFGDLSPRPIKKIYTNKQIFSYGGISSEIVSQDFINNIISNVTTIEKKLEITSVLKKYISIEELKNLLFSINNPQIISIDYKKKYHHLPYKLVEYILKKEQKIITVIENNKIINFYFIADKLFKLNSKKFQITIDGRLEDLCISYERDIKLVKFHHKQKELWEFCKYLLNKYLENISEKYLKELINNYKSDFFTSIIEEYPNLIGILSSHIYDKNILVKEGFLALSGELKNIYGSYLYLTINIFFLENLYKNNKLPTAKNDPFGVRHISNTLLEIIIYNDLWNLNINDGVKIFLKERLYIMLNKKYSYGNILNYTNIDFEFITKIIPYIEINYKKIKNIINRCKYFVNNQVSQKYFADINEFINEIKKTEEILNNEKIQKNLKLKHYINDFMGKIKNLFYLNNIN